MRSTFRRENYSLNDALPFLDRKNLKRFQPIVRRVNPQSERQPANPPSSPGGNRRFTRQPAVTFRSRV